MFNLRFVGFFLFFYLVATSVLFSQEKFITHKIKQGETISSIAEKYNVSQKVIFELNPKAKGLLKLNAELKIPNNNFKKAEKQKGQKGPKEAAKITKVLVHEVLPKETLFSIAKKFNVTLEALKKSNPELEKKGLRKGQKISVEVPKDFELPIVEINNSTEENQRQTSLDLSGEKSKQISNSEFIFSKDQLQSHAVIAGETKYGISKRYGISLADLEKLNPSIANISLNIGQELQVPMMQKTKEEVKEETKEEENTIVQNSPKNEESTIPSEKVTPEVKNVVEGLATSTNEETEITQHEVKSKETKYGIAKKYGISVLQLEEWNPTIKGALRVGAVLQVKAPSSETAVVENNAVTPAEKETEVVEKHDDYFYGDLSLADQLIERASDNIGVRYRSGGTTRAGFDCSGLICATFSAMDIKLPRSSIEQSNIGTKVTPQEAKKGDLIFFKTRGGQRINHVGMVVDVVDGEIKFIHSSTSQGVIISSTKESYYHRNFAQVNRVLR